MRNIIRILIAVVILIVVELYFTKKVTRALKNTFPNFSARKIKIIFRIFLIWINMYPLFLIINWSYAAVSGNSVWVPQHYFFDYFLIYPFWVGILLIIQSDLFFIILDIFKLLLLPVWKKNKAKLIPYEAKIILLIAGFLLVYVPARIIYDDSVISIRPVEYKVEDLPEGLNNFRLTFISDIQADRYTDKERLNNFIEKVNSTNPDLVLIAGDVITSTPTYINEAAKYIGQIKSKYGIYSCVGDHDNWAYRNDYQRSLREISSALQKQGIEMIDNGNKSITINNSELGITFITNTYVTRISPGKVDSIASLKNNFDLKIFLTHQPREYLIQTAIKHNYDLFLAGHTHGGQVTFLFPLMNLSPTLFETLYVRGNFYFDDMLMIVTRGLGMSLAPIRYNSTPEVMAIMLTRK